MLEYVKTIIYWCSAVQRSFYLSYVCLLFFILVFEINFTLVRFSSFYSATFLRSYNFDTEYDFVKNAAYTGSNNEQNQIDQQSYIIR